MEVKERKYNTIDEYIAGMPDELQARLQSIRKLIKQQAPDAQEKISWQMPTFYLYGNLIHFAAAKNHIGIYPGASGVEHFARELQAYKTSKGAIQLPHNKPIPEELLKKIVRFRVQENLAEEDKRHKQKQK